MRVEEQQVVRVCVQCAKKTGQIEDLVAPVPGVALRRRVRSRQRGAKGSAWANIQWVAVWRESPHTVLLALVFAGSEREAGLSRGMEQRRAARAVMQQQQEEQLGILALRAAAAVAARVSARVARPCAPQRA